MQKTKQGLSFKNNRPAFIKFTHSANKSLLVPAVCKTLDTKDVVVRNTFRPRLSGVVALIGRQVFIKPAEQRTEMGNINQKGARRSRPGSGFRRKCYKMRLR